MCIGELQTLFGVKRCSELKIISTYLAWNTGNGDSTLETGNIDSNGISSFIFSFFSCCSTNSLKAIT